VQGSSPEGDARIAKIQKDVKELWEATRDSWHDQREKFEKRIKDVLAKNRKCVPLWLEIDGIRSMIEIEDSLKSEGKTISHATLWRLSKKLLNAGLIKKVGVKGISPIYSKKPGVKELNLDEYVREEFVEKEPEA